MIPTSFTTQLGFQTDAKPTSHQSPHLTSATIQPIALSQPSPFLVPTPQFASQPAVGATQLSLAEMESIITPLTRRRSEGFAQQEVKLMIKEIEKRRHILLSMSPTHNKLKRRAWEEVANAMAQKFPHENRRTGEQVSITLNNQYALLNYLTPLTIESHGEVLWIGRYV